MSKNEKISYIGAVIIGTIYVIYQQSRKFDIVKLLCFFMALILFYFFILYLEKRANKNKWDIFNDDSEQ